MTKFKFKQKDQHEKKLNNTHFALSDRSFGDNALKLIILSNASVFLFAL